VFANDYRFFAMQPMTSLYYSLIEKDKIDFSVAALHRKDKAFYSGVIGRGTSGAPRPMFLSPKLYCGLVLSIRQPAERNLFPLVISLCVLFFLVFLFWITIPHLC